MSQENNIRDLALRISTEFNTIEALRGNLSSLATTDKASLVAAINEVLTLANSMSQINDGVTALDSTWSSTKVNNEISAAVANLVDGAPEVLNTLSELATALTDNDADIATILTGLSNRVRTDINNQGLTATQQANARTNIGAPSAADIGDTNRDFVADFEGGLN